MRILLLLVALGTLPSPSRAEVAVRHLEAQANGRKVSVGFVLDGAFEREEVLRELQSGLPTVFTYEIELIRKRPNWFDSTLARSRVELIATFNSVTRDYLLNHRRDRKLVRSETIREFEELARRMTQVMEKDLFDTGGRSPSKLRVRVRGDVTQELMFYIVPRRVRTSWQAVRVESLP